MSRYAKKGTFLSAKNSDGRNTWYGLCLGDWIYWLPTKENDRPAQAAMKLRNLDLSLGVNSNISVVSEPTESSK